MGCLSGCVISSASIQKLFCGICLVFKCSFDEFVGEKVVSPSYSSAVLGPPLHIFLIYLPVNGHLSCFHDLAIVNSAAMNIGVHFSNQFWIYFLITYLLFSFLGS